MWRSLKFRPNCLTEDYENWEAVGHNGYTPLSALWEFEYELISHFQPRYEDGSLLPLDEPCIINKELSEKLYQCSYHNIDMTKEQAMELHSNEALPMPNLNHQLWTDGSKRKELGASGIVWTEDNQIVSTIAKRYYPIFSSFQIEINAIRDGLDHFIVDERSNGLILSILTDSQSSLKHLRSLSLKPRLVSKVVYELVKSVHKAFEAGLTEIKFCWVHGHADINRG